jgi:hypothetical protein
MNKPRGKPFVAGNKFGRGRPRGSRNKLTLAAQQLLEQYSASIVRKCITQALQGDPHAMRLCMDRLVAVRRDTPIRLKMPQVVEIGDISQAEQNVLQSIAVGQLTTVDGDLLMKVLASRRRSIETDDLCTRVKALEEAERQNPAEDHQHADKDAEMRSQ